MKIYELSKNLDIEQAECNTKFMNEIINKLERNYNQMTHFERLEQYTKGNIVEGIDFKRDLEIVIQDYKLQEQYVKHLEQDKENMKKIINILCDTISQLI